jgi:predicted nucleotidyltransferase
MNDMYKICTKDYAIDIVRNYAREIEAQGVNLRTVILFGSYLSD